MKRRRKKKILKMRHSNNPLVSQRSTDFNRDRRFFSLPRSRALFVPTSLLIPPLYSRPCHCSRECTRFWVSLKNPVRGRQREKQTTSQAMRDSATLVHFKPVQISKVKNRRTLRSPLNTRIRENTCVRIKRKKSTRQCNFCRR